jgi:hypothetical protein
VKVDICTKLNILAEAISDKYLGLPTMIGLDKSDSFLYLLEKIIERLKRWKGKILSMGGKELLLKAIMQSIPLFAVGVFKLQRIM